MPGIFRPSQIINRRDRQRLNRQPFIVDRPSRSSSVRVRSSTVEIVKRPTEIVSRLDRQQSESDRQPSASDHQPFRLDLRFAAVKST